MVIHLCLREVPNVDALFSQHNVFPMYNERHNEEFEFVACCAEVVAGFPEHLAFSFHVLLDILIYLFILEFIHKPIFFVRSMFRPLWIVVRMHCERGKMDGKREECAGSERHQVQIVCMPNENGDHLKLKLVLSLYQ